MSEYLITNRFWKPKGASEILERYGGMELKDKAMIWPNAHKWLETWTIPEQIKLFYQNKRIYKFSANKDIHKPLDAAFANIIWAGVQSELKTFDGCFNVRYIRGNTAIPSMHSWGLAIDLNASLNPLGGKSSWSPTFVKCWTDVGWAWGGNFVRKDPMHFEWKGGI